MYHFWVEALKGITESTSFPVADLTIMKTRTRMELPAGLGQWAPVCSLPGHSEADSYSYSVGSASRDQLLALSLISAFLHKFVLHGTQKALLKFKEKAEEKL